MDPSPDPSTLRPACAPETVLQHWAEDTRPYNAVVPPIVQTSLFTFDSVEQLRSAMDDPLSGSVYHYSRLGNPTLDVAERKIAALEKGDACKLFGSGMGAITAAIMATTEPGSHAICLDTAYGPTRMFFTDVMTRMGVTTTFVQGDSLQSFSDAVRPETKLIYLESPSSLIFSVLDLRAIAQFARERSINTVIDNTWCTPLYQQPLDLGIDISVHSASKYLGGHSDVVGGALITDAERMDRIIRREVALFGAIMAPFPAWLVLRGLRTLKVRLDAHQAAALAVAAWLEQQPWVAQVHHPGLPSHSSHAMHMSQATGSSGLFSFEPRQQQETTVNSFCNELKWFQIGVSWGGYESLVVPLNLHPIGWQEPRQVIRLHIGLESVADLIADIDSAAERSGLKRF